MTATQEVTVIQGYSPPVPVFTVQPDSGNIKVLFSFDAGGTRDAQEGTNLLTFAWDFNNDQKFDLTQVGNPIAEHRFSEAGKYLVTLQVTDTSRLSAFFRKEVTVNRLDTLIRPVLVMAPEFPTDQDTVRISAVGSYYKDNPNMGLRYAWKRSGAGWLEPGTNPEYVWPLPPNGSYRIQVQVYSEEGLYNFGEIEVVVSRANKKPTARITRNMRFGNILSIFDFSAWSSSDPEGVPSDLQARWDFEGDGNWDTNFSYEKNMRRVFTVPGVYNVTLQVMDKEGLKDEATADIHVSGYSNPTSQLKDNRDGQVYGIVQIGDQWWMGENLKWIPDRLGSTERTPWICYNDQPANCEVLGRLYHAATVAAHLTGETEDRNICPHGWHLPAPEEYRELIDRLGAASAGTALAYGGSSDFNLLPGGYAAYHMYGGFEEFETDSIYRVAYLMTQSIGSSTATLLQHRRNDMEVNFRTKPVDGYYSVRCVKNK
jgi:uncharacterized protein (TIGR02145 family)